MFLNSKSLILKVLKSNIKYNITNLKSNQSFKYIYSFELLFITLY
jgi:hypothetical protein